MSSARGAASSQESGTESSEGAAAAPRRGAIRAAWDDEEGRESAPTSEGRVNNESA